MNAPNPSRQLRLPPAEEVAKRIDALLTLRQQMLELHARLEYLRLMMRIGRRLPPPR